MEALYRKYRPSTFSDVVGQEHIERTLKNAIGQGKVSHAYLFCGPRGTGKTTMARILAKALLCEKGPTTDPDGTCPECEAIAQGTHPDVYELDAASRTGVDNVREEIISRVNYAPTQGAWKVYIIDEVHMLSTAAFNALLKTLEEPPDHVVFILCTTDPQKVPETIQSRCQRFDFHRISAEAIVSRLGAICVSEGVDFEGEALDLIAYRAEGGMRNALTSLEQLIAFGGGQVTLEGAQNLLGSLDETDLSEIIIAIGKRDAAACFNWVAHYVETGADLAQFVRDLAEHVRNLYLLSMAGIEVEIHVSEATRTAMVDQLKYFGEDRLARLLMVLGDLSKDLRTATNPRLSFEIALTRMIRPESDYTIEALAERVEELERKLEGGAYQLTQAPLPTSSSGMAQEPSVVLSSRQAQAQTQVQAQAQAAASSAPSQVETPISTSPSSEVKDYASVQAATQTPNPTSPTASIDLSNPAAVQRFWHAVTTALRKANPARGVLFMNAKISADAQGSGLVIGFSKDNGFAFTAAQKPEVQQLLAQTIESVAGGSVPYRLELEAGAPGVAATAMMQNLGARSVSTPASVSASPAGSTAGTTSAPTPNSATASYAEANNSQGQPSSQTSRAQQVREAVAAAQARVAQANSTQGNATLVDSPQISPASSVDVGQPNAAQSGAMQPGVGAQVNVGQTAAVQANAMRSTVPGANEAQTQQQPVMTGQVPTSASMSGESFTDTVPASASSDVSSFADEQVPLEAYGDVGSFQETGGAVDYQVPVQDKSVQDGFQGNSVSPTSSQISNQGNSASPISSASVKRVDPAAGDEASQIKEILSNSFGDGIKFEELSD